MEPIAQRLRAAMAPAAAAALGPSADFVVAMLADLHDGGATREDAETELLRTLCDDAAMPRKDAEAATQSLVDALDWAAAPAPSEAMPSAAVQIAGVPMLVPGLLDESMARTATATAATKASADTCGLSKAQQRRQRKAVSAKPTMSSAPQDGLDRGSGDSSGSEDAADSRIDSDEEFGSQNSRFRADHVGDSQDVHLRGVFLSFLNNSHDLLDGATLKLIHGRRHGLVGANGVGKSTLLRAIARRQLKDFPQHLRVVFIDQEVAGDQTSALKWLVNADSELVALRKEEENLLEDLHAAGASERLADVCARLALKDADTVEDRARELLKSMQFTDKMIDAPTVTLSGGWRMRVALARAIFAPSDILLLDEPTNHLDLPTILWLQRFIVKCGRTVIVVSHDRAFLNAVTTDIILFAKQKLSYYAGNYDAYEKAREEKLQKQLHLFDWQTRTEQHIKESINKAMSHARTSGDDKVLGQVASRKKKLERLGAEKREDGSRWRVATRRKDGSFDWLRQRVEAPEIHKPIVFTFEDPPPLLYNGPTLQLQSVTVRYVDGATVLTDVTMDLSARDARIALVGANGAGKSTLLNVIAGKLPPAAGSIMRHHSLRIGLFAQHEVGLFNQAITAVGHVQQRYPELNEHDARKVLASFGLSGPIAMQPIRTLSGGQQSRILLATLAYTCPHLLILDEPSNHLDIETVDALADALRRFNGAVLLAAHDQHLIRSVAKDVYLVADGRVQPSTLDHYIAKIARSTPNLPMMLGSRG